MNAGPAIENELALALELADLADRLSLSRFGAADLVVESKPDMTPVTETDRDVEVALRDRLAEARPNDALLGEEQGAHGNGPRRWIIDPIDGTKNYVRGVPVFATLIALADDDEPLVGVVSAPALGRRWWAGRGLGAYLNGRRIAVSRVARLEDAHLSYNDLRTFYRHGVGAEAAALADSVWRVRGFGDFWSHTMVAEGSVDISTEPIVNPWDLAALQVIVEEAGGMFTDLEGRRGFSGGSVLASNGVLHQQALDFFKPSNE